MVLSVMVPRKSKGGLERVRPVHVTRVTRSRPRVKPWRNSLPNNDLLTVEIETQTHLSSPELGLSCTPTVCVAIDRAQLPTRIYG